VRYLPAELLREVNVVDTPGTNVILSRQQRLTEEYVPRADLVLFVLSADRPFTESEVNFLKYIRRAHILTLPMYVHALGLFFLASLGVCRACKGLQLCHCWRISLFELTHRQFGSREVRELLCCRHKTN